MRRLALACVLGLLAGCSAAPPRSDAPLVRDVAALAGLADWQASGRIAVRSDQEGFSAHFDWQQDAGTGVLAVRGPFGAGAARIRIDAGRVRIEQGSEAPLEIPAPFDALDATLRTRLGFPLPLGSLRYWLLGVPAPGGEPAAVEGDAFVQAGWRVVARAFVPVPGAPAPLPGQLEMTQGPTRIRVIVDAWQAGPR